MLPRENVEFLASLERILRRGLKKSYYHKKPFSKSYPLPSRHFCLDCSFLQVLYSFCHCLEAEPPLPPPDYAIVWDSEEVFLDSTKDLY
jgi:hypothetical protein